MAPAGNTDARYSTSNKSQGDMYVVNININIQGRPGKSSSEVAELTLIALQLRRTFFFSFLRKRLSAQPRQHEAYLKDRFFRFDETYLRDRHRRGVL